MSLSDNDPTYACWNPLGVALDQCSPRRCLVIRQIVLHRAQVVVLVLERMRELVGERRP